MLMEFKQLYYFTQAAKYGSYSTAAKMLFVTPQALSKSILHLEKEYNCQLFIRKNSKLILSNVGQQILVEAKDLLERYYMLDQHLKELSEVKSAHFKVVITQNSLNIVDINLFKTFKELNPQLNPHYIELPDKLVDEYIEADRVEVCFNINELPNQDEYESILIFSSEICTVTHKDHYLAKKDFVTLQDLRNEKIVLKSELYKSFDILSHAAKMEDINLKYELKTTDETLMLEHWASAECAGIGVYAIKDKINDFKPIPFKPSLPWNIYLSYKKYKSLSKPVQLFIKFVKENYAINVNGKTEI